MLEKPTHEDAALTRQALLKEGETLSKRVLELPKVDGLPDFSKASIELKALIDAYVEKMAANRWLPEWS